MPSHAVEAALRGRGGLARRCRAYAIDEHRVFAAPCRQPLTSPGAVALIAQPKAGALRDIPLAPLQSGQPCVDLDTPPSRCATWLSNAADKN